MASFICSKCHTQFTVEQAVAKTMVKCPICGGSFAAASLRSTSQSHSLQATSAAPADPASVIDHLKVEAEHKAHLKMFYAGADVLRAYQGPFSRETAETREKLAQEFDDRGHVAEQERLAHGPLTISTAATARHLGTQPPGTHSFAHWPVSHTSQTSPDQPPPASPHKPVRKCHLCHHPILDEFSPCPYCKQRAARQQRLLVLAVAGAVVVVLATAIYAFMHPPVNKAELQALNGAILAGNLEQTRQLAAADHSLINAAVSSGQTPLGNAVDAGNVAIAALLLANGADINERGRQCLTPVMLAVNNADKKMVAFLLQHGADANLTECRNGLSALHLVGSDDNQAGVEIAQLLVSYGANVNLKNDALLGVTPLSCCSDRKSAVADYLRSQGAHK